MMDEFDPAKDAEDNSHSHEDYVIHKDGIKPLPIDLQRWRFPPEPPMLDLFEKDPLSETRDLKRRYPAARCRECGVITYYCTAKGKLKRFTAKRVQERDEQIHLDGGWKLKRDCHARGCSRPTGRLDLLRLARLVSCQDPAYESWIVRLSKQMTNAEVKAAKDELLEYLRSKKCRK